MDDVFLFFVLFSYTSFLTQLCFPLLRRIVHFTYYIFPVRQNVNTPNVLLLPYLGLGLDYAIAVKVVFSPT